MSKKAMSLQSLNLRRKKKKNKGNRSEHQDESRIMLPETLILEVQEVKSSDPEESFGLEFRIPLIPLAGERDMISLLCIC